MSRTKENREKRRSDDANRSFASVANSKRWKLFNAVYNLCVCSFVFIINFYFLVLFLFVQTKKKKMEIGVVLGTKFCARRVLFHLLVSLNACTHFVYFSLSFFFIIDTIINILFTSLSEFTDHLIAMQFIPTPSKKKNQPTAVVAAAANTYISFYLTFLSLCACVDHIFNSKIVFRLFSSAISSISILSLLFYCTNSWIEWALQ